MVRGVCDRTTCRTGFAILSRLRQARPGSSCCQLDGGGPAGLRMLVFGLDGPGGGEPAQQCSSTLLRSEPGLVQTLRAAGPIVSSRSTSDVGRTMRAAAGRFAICGSLTNTGLAYARHPAGDAGHRPAADPGSRGALSGHC